VAPRYAKPATRCDEILRARGLTPTEVAKRAGWQQAYLSRLITGKIPLTRHNQVLAARALECPVAVLHEPIGAPIPPRLAVAGLGLAERARAIATLIGAESGDGVMAYLVYGDDRGLSNRAKVRLHDALTESDEMQSFVEGMSIDRQLASD
jgi:transcriptional regulator with XRE-family HTH domain